MLFDDFCLEKSARCNTLVVTRQFVRERRILVWRRGSIFRRAWGQFVDNGPPFISTGDGKRVNCGRGIELNSVRHCIQFFLREMLDNGTANGISEDVDRSAEAITAKEDRRVRDSDPSTVLTEANRRHRWCELLPRVDRVH